MSSNSSKKSCEILISMARAEKQLEIMRQALCEISNFEPYAAFKQLDLQRKNYLQTPDFQNFLQKNQMNFDESLIDHILIKHYDYDHDGKLCYAEFLRIILPNDEPGLRTLVTQRPTYSGDLPEEIEEALVKLLQTEISIVGDLEPMKRELLEGNSCLISQLFHEIDKDSTGFINFANLFDFFKKNGIYPYEEEIIAIIRKLDKDDDGRLVLEELEEGLGSIEAKENSLQNKFERLNYEDQERKPKDYSRFIENNVNESQKLYKTGTFNPINSSHNNNKTTSVKKSYKYEGKYQPKYPYDEASTDKPLKYEANTTEDIKSQEKPSRNYKYQDNSTSYRQKETMLTSSYSKKPVQNFEKMQEDRNFDQEPKEYLSKFQQKDYKISSKTNSNIKTDYNTGNVTKSPPHTYYYPYEPIRKAFSPMKDKILKSSRFDEEPLEKKTRGYQMKQDPTRTRTPITKPESWKIEDKLKRIDDTYAKNSRYHGLTKESNGEENVNLIKSAPKQMLYRDYTPDPSHSKRLYETSNMTPDHMFDTNYMQSSQYRKDKDIVNKIMGPSESAKKVYQESTNYSSSYKMKTPVKFVGSSNETRDLAGFLGSLMNYEGEIERMKQDLALRPDFNIVDLFVFFDEEKKGYCTLEEFQESLSKLELFIQEKEALLFIKRLDKGGSGTMKFADFTYAFTPSLSDYLDLLNQRKPINTDLQFSYKELFSQETIRLISNIFRGHFTNEIAIEGMRKALARKNELDLKRLFEAVDMDQDGYLNENELEAFVSSHGLGLNGNKNDGHLLLERLDNDKDGKVSFEEFCFELTTKLEDLE